jgi:hypothetical protein
VSSSYLLIGSWCIGPWPEIGHSGAPAVSSHLRAVRTVAARLALAFEHPSHLLLWRGRLAAGIEPGVGEGACGGEDWYDDSKEGIAWGWYAHRPTMPNPSATRLPVSGRDADCGVDQFVRKDRCDLRWHGVGRVPEIGPDEDFEMAIRARPVVPALADRLALLACAGTTDRDADAVGQGGSNASNSGAMPCATRFSQLSRLSCSMSSSPFKSPSGRWPWPSALPRGEQRGRGAAALTFPASERCAGLGRLRSSEIRHAVLRPASRSEPGRAKTACGLGERSD